MKKLLILLPLILLSGCSTTNISQLMHEMAGDTNAVQVIVSTPWGSMTVNRNFRQQTP